ncbi:MAG: HAD family hydrolase [Gammaproteobacteria bacterium]|nr:HAD family hydrolase [Gammaproteobacteria bacterium]
MRNFELIIFDCDGVLVDSERITAEVFSKVLNEECGLSLSLDVLLETFMGQSSQKCLTIIEKMIGQKPPLGLEARYQNEINNALQESVTAITGIEKALAELSIPYCVASGGTHEKMRTTLGKTNLLGQFEGKLFSTSDVPRGKPYPDVFLHAAKSMQCLDPNRCLVIEDSPLGVEGGIAAGMTVFGFADLIKKQKLIESGAHHIITEMSNLAKEITLYEHGIH